MRHRSRSDFRGRFPGHVTLKLREGLRSLRTGCLVRALQATLREACDTLRVGWRRHGLLDPSEVPGLRAT